MNKNDGPMHFLSAGVVLFPGATLPLRVIQSRLVVTIDKALRLTDAPCTIGVVRTNHVRSSS
jgi:cereblon